MTIEKVVEEAFCEVVNTLYGGRKWSLCGSIFPPLPSILCFLVQSFSPFFFVLFEKRAFITLLLPHTTYNEWRAICLNNAFDRAKVALAQ